MGRVETALREEIRRLARKTARELQAKTVEDVRRLKGKVAALQAELSAVKSARADEEARRRMSEATRALPDAEAAAAKIRMSPDLIKKLRRRLKVTQPAFARLVGVSNAAVGFWEAGRTAPRPAMKVKIAALRKAGRRDVQRLLAQKAAATKRSGKVSSKARRGKKSRRRAKK